MLIVFFRIKNPFPKFCRPMKQFPDNNTCMYTVSGGSAVLFVVLLTPKLNYYNQSQTMNLSTLLGY